MEFNTVISNQTQTSIFPSPFTEVCRENPKTKPVKYANIKEEGYSYIETKGGKINLMLLHGLFGSLSNFSGILNQFGSHYNVIVPTLPIFETSPRKLSLPYLLDYIAGFVSMKGFEKMHIVGNSLGGHIALLYALKFPHKTASITLTGSSGLFENAFGTGFPRRTNYDYIRRKTEDIFYNPSMASKDLVDEVYGIVNDRSRVIQVLAAAKSAIRNNLRNHLPALNIPTLLVWGNEDKVTPVVVGQEFNRLIRHSQLVTLDRCGHAPMMEREEVFNAHLHNFITGVDGSILYQPL